MLQYDLLTKLDELKELKVREKQICAQISALEDEIKNEMDKRNVENLFIGSYAVSYSNVSQTRFDSAKFKKEHFELFSQYSRQVSYRRFSLV